MLYELTVPACIKGLRNLSHILEKAAGFADLKKTPMEVLLNSRLAVDQFALTRQIQIACDTAKFGAARLSGQTAPTNDDSEKSLAKIQTRIHSTISFLETLNKDQYKDAEAKHITQPRWEGKWMTGEEYALQHVLPNLYFHITTAYAILRNCGADVGKNDYLGQLPYKH